MKRPTALAAAAVGVAAVATGAVLGFGAHSNASTSSRLSYAAQDTAAWAQTSGRSHVPSQIRVPKGNHLKFSLHVLQGVQVYACTNGAWTFQEPDSNMALVGSDQPTVLYTAGPEWVSTVDGSAVWGMPKVSVPEHGTIADLLVQAVKTRGTGAFGDISWIQRIDTKGGLPPAGSCTNGTITASRYWATERFWAPNTTGAHMAAATSGYAAAPQVKVPSQLQVPAGNHKVAALRVVVGAQVYTCTNSAWVFTEPAANLAPVHSNHPVALHSAGPEWVSTVDGSKVMGTAVASVTEPNAVPELLLKSTMNRGTGMFGSVDYVQRLATMGGLPPTGSCTNGAIDASPYHAVYQFWAPNSHS